ncbi:glycosyltransferase [Novosphingobium album (ex Liu et al. 2023)]|uniref:Glycosyltransferase n=1 Tax=Novosphingobium album (ex Liu et al. 2023) TaxID=3031130 RepID=A0ABT5WTI3_9SPHN|nr:glycosyltransferase [Novosphingobium album (ex Liu et al. 2023)]MDE8653193.1 glycosyltransferase [Novosphingobium album (ex Liu et al. 2023)]
MRILHIAQILQGGTASHMNELIALQSRSSQVHWLGLLAPMDEVHYLDSARIGHLRTFASSARNPRALWAFAQAARQTILETRPDIIHLHGTFAGFVVRLLGLVAWQCRRPTVYCSHGWAFNMRMGAPARGAFALAERLLARRTEKILCISRFEMLSAKERGLPIERLAMVYNGIEDNAGTIPAINPEGDILRLLFVGRDCRQKGFDILVDAIRLIAEKPIRLEAAGPEPRAGLPENIEALGWIDRADVSHRLARADALVMPSRWEGFGLAALEAMRQGKAVIAASVDALPELVIHGETGILVPPDDPQALAGALSGLTRETLQEMGRQGRAHYLANFTAVQMHREIERIYGEICPPAKAW